MNFTELVTELKHYSGGTNMSNARAAALLNAGMHYLEALQPLSNMQIYSETSLADGEYSLNLATALYVKGVWIKDTTDDSWVLISYKTVDEIIAIYPKLGDTDSGTPNCWTYEPPDRSSLETNEYSVDIQIMPPSDGATDVKIYYEHSLANFTESGSTATNIWTTTYPLLLIMAATMQREMLYGNQSRLSALSEGIDRELNAIDINLVKKELAVGHIMERGIKAGSGNDVIQYVDRYVEGYKQVKVTP